MDAVPCLRTARTCCTYNRIQAARAVLRFPQILTELEDGAVTVTTIRLLAGVLTTENAGEVLLAARHKSKRNIERLVVTVCPKPDAPSIVRKLPTTSPREIRMVPLLSPNQAKSTGEPSTDAPAVTAHIVAITRPPVPTRPTVVAPLAPDRYKIQFTASGTMQGKLRRAQALLRHSIPNGDPALMFERALDVLLGHLEKTKLAAAGRPRTPRSTGARSRHIPASVKRAIWQRDGAQYAFVGAEGRCTERGFLELHHVLPFADGGEATVANIELRCRAHNGYEAQRWFGPLVVRERRPRYGLLPEGAWRSRPIEVWRDMSAKAQ